MELPVFLCLVHALNTHANAMDALRESFVTFVSETKPLFSCN